MRIMLHFVIILLKLKSRNLKDIPFDIQGIIRELKHKRRFVMSNETDFDFSLIVNDVESSDGQTRYQYFESNETETEEINQK